MLQLPALVAWTHHDAKDLIGNIDFVGVFVPADISWGAQLEALGGKNLHPSLRERLGLAAFTTHVLIALVDAMQDCLDTKLSQHATLSRFWIDLSRAQQVEIVEALSRGWLLECQVPSLVGLRISLRERLSRIGELATEAASGAASDDFSFERFINLDFLQSSSLGIEVFNSITGRRYQKWAFLFDELEIAPELIRRKLLLALRSADQRMLFKLSLSPYTADMDITQTARGASADQDYHSIELSYSYKEDSYEFTAELVTSLLRANGCNVDDLDEVFGEAEFDEGRVDQIELGSAYRPGARQYNKFKQLADKDGSFRKYLVKYGINIETMHAMRDPLRASYIRKVTSLVSVRNAFRNSELSPVREATARGRKNPRLYTGSTSIFAVAEGNPRWIIGMLGPLIREYAANGLQVSRSEQAAAIAVSSNRFRALLSTIPVGTGQRTQGFRNLVSILDSIGNFFFREAVLRPFSPEPPSTFVVDADTPLHVVEALGRALNAGAVVHLPDKPGQKVLGELLGKRFRLSYMLAPYYKIVPTAGKGRALSRILSRIQGDSLFENEPSSDPSP